MSNTKIMKIIHYLYRVEVREMPDPADLSKVILELHEIEDLGPDSKRDILLKPKQDLKLVAGQVAMDNKAHEKMMLKIKKPGEQFILTQKIITE